jgi:hypothetical protein
MISDFVKTRLASWRWPLIGAVFGLREGGRS